MFGFCVWEDVLYPRKTDQTELRFENIQAYPTSKGDFESGF